MVPFSLFFNHLCDFSYHKEELVSSSAQETKVALKFKLKVYMLGDAMSF
jgi:hypothetical protein